MRWQTKSRLFAALSRLAFGFWLHRFLQRLFSHRLRRPLEGFALCRDKAALLVAKLEQATGRRACDLSVLEIGAGRDLAMALALKAAGIGRVVALDVQRLARPWLVRRAAAQLITHKIVFRTLDDLSRLLGLAYKAPCTLAMSGVPEQSLDLIFSNEVLEHVPPVELVVLLADAKRFLRPDGRLIAVIDYSDHFSHNDPLIGPHHFLRFDEKTWRRHNSALHYQNRLRHKEHVALWQAAGFEILSATLGKMPVSPEEDRARSGRFQAMSLDDLSIINAEIIAQPRQG